MTTDNDKAHYKLRGSAFWVSPKNMFVKQASGLLAQVMKDNREEI